MAGRRSGKGARKKGSKTHAGHDSISLDSFVNVPPENEGTLSKGSKAEGTRKDVILDNNQVHRLQESGSDDNSSSSNLSLLERSERAGDTTEMTTSGNEMNDAMTLIPTASGKIPDINAMDIDAKDARIFLSNLKRVIDEKKNVNLFFHNDMDGLNGALIINEMLKKTGPVDIIIHATPLEYSDLTNLALDDDVCHIFIDMDIARKGPNIFRIDHHGEQWDHREVTENLFLLTPSEKDYEYPSSATALCGYLSFISDGGRMSFLRYLGRGNWQNDPFKRLLILLSSVCDNLWHLNFLIDIPMKRWVPDPEEERYLVLISISASLLLGDDEKRNEIMDDLFDIPVTPEDYLGRLCGSLTGARNVLSFTESISREAEGFYNRIFFNITDSIERTISTWEKDNKVLKELEISMPIDMRGSRDKMMELLKTKGDPSTDHWKRIEFYGKEMERLENKIKLEERKLLKLRAAKKMFSAENGPRLCVVIPRQGSKQIKGIIASLLYYKGWKNIVIEERGGEAAWGARGFSKKIIESYFSNLSMGYDELKDYLFMEKVYKELPVAFKKTINISKNVSFYKTYEGGMGGRGHIFGGSLRGKVPWIFSLLEESGDMEDKIRELMKHKELGDALRGLTEGQSEVSTAQALRAKFKSTGWLVVSLITGKDGADVLLGNFRMGIMHLVGYNERFQFYLQEQEREIHMDHGRFDVAD